MIGKQSFMKQLLIISIIALVTACGGKKSESTTPANKTGTTTGSGSMGGATYGGGAGSAMSQPTSGGDPCAN
jgi:hypothetical protein